MFQPRARKRSPARLARYVRILPAITRSLPFSGSSPHHSRAPRCERRSRRFTPTRGTGAGQGPPSGRRGARGHRTEDVAGTGPQSGAESRTARAGSRSPTVGPDPSREPWRIRARSGRAKTPLGRTRHGQDTASMNGWLGPIRSGCGWLGPSRVR